VRKARLGALIVDLMGRSAAGIAWHSLEHALGFPLTLRRHSSSLSAAIRPHGEEKALGPARLLLQARVAYAQRMGTAHRRCTGLRFKPSAWPPGYST